MGYCWQLLPRLPLPLRLTPPSCTELMVVWDMPVSMEDTHMLPLLCFLMLPLSPVTLSQLLLEVIRLLLDPTETLLDPSMRFPALSLPSLLQSKSPVEMSARALELVPLFTPHLFTIMARGRLRLTLLSCTVAFPMPVSMVVWDMPVPMDTHMPPMPLLMLSSLSSSRLMSPPPTSQSQLPLEDTRLRPETMETLSEPSIMFPAFSLPLPFLSKRTPTVEPSLLAPALLSPTLSSRGKLRPTQLSFTDLTDMVLDTMDMPDMADMDMPDLDMPDMVDTQDTDMLTTVKYKEWICPGLSQKWSYAHIDPKTIKKISLKI